MVSAMARLKNAGAMARLKNADTMARFFDESTMQKASWRQLVDYLGSNNEKPDHLKGRLECTYHI